MPVKIPQGEVDPGLKRAEGVLFWQLPSMTRLNSRAEGLSEGHVATSPSSSHICPLQRKVVMANSP